MSPWLMVVVGLLYLWIAGDSGLRKGNWGDFIIWESYAQSLIGFYINATK